MKNLRQRWLHLLLERRPHHQSDHQRVQEKHRRLANTVSSVAFMFREKGPRDQGCSHDELHDQVEICPEGCASTEKAPHWEERQHFNHPFHSHLYDLLIARKLFRPNIVWWLAKGRRRDSTRMAAYILLKTKLISFVWFAPIVIVWVAVPSFSCQALMVYVPGGRLGRAKLPSCFVQAKYGFLRTAIYPRIQGWILHLTGIAISSLANASSTVAPGSSALFHSRLLAGVG